MLTVHVDGITTRHGRAMADLSIEGSTDPANNGGSSSTVALVCQASSDELDTVIERLMAARHQLKVARQHTAGCPDCTLKAIEEKK